MGLFNPILCISLKVHKDLFGDHQYRKHYLQRSKNRNLFSQGFP